MKDVILCVRPASGGWGVATNLPIHTAYYRSGACAEGAARALAMRLAGSGFAVEMQVRDRREAVVATQRYEA